MKGRTEGLRCIQEDDGWKFIPFSGWLKLVHTQTYAYVLVFLIDHRVIRKRTEDTIVALHPETIQGIEIS